QLDHRLDAAQPGLHAARIGRRGDGIDAADLDVGIVPAHRPAEIDDATGAQHAAQGALGLLFAPGPARAGAGRARAEKMVLHHLEPSLAARRLPMPRLPSSLTPLPFSPPAPCSATASIWVIDPWVNR